MKAKFEELLKKMNSKASIEWINESEANFSSNNGKKNFKGKVKLNDYNISLKNIKTNYSNSYLLNKIRSYSTPLNINLSSSNNDLSLYFSPQIGDSVTLLNSNYFNNINLGDHILLKNNFTYRQFNNGPIECGPIGSLKQNFNAVVTHMFSSTCVNGTILSNYIKFQLLS